MTPESIPGAMASGSLPIGVTYEPNVSQILGMPGDKYHVVYSSKDAPGLITDVLVFDEKVIAKRPLAIKAMLAGYLDGLAYMQAHPDEAAKIIGKVLHSAVANAEQISGVDIDNLTVKQVIINPGPTHKRIMTRSMGRAFRIVKRTSHITVVVAEN